MSGEEFKQARLALGLTQAQLGDILRMNQRRISALETGYGGRKPTLGHALIMKILLFVKNEGLLLKLWAYLKE